jgi:FtsP/CotA-like multicopper oxidase with cupredoxin domain
MKKLWESKVSRRRLLGGAAAGTAALPVIHELVPHRSLHGADAAAAPRHGAGHAAAGTGRVDPRSNGFDPSALLRDFDRGTLRGNVREFELAAEDKEIEVAPGGRYPAWTYNGRVPGPTLRATEGEKLRVRFTNGSSHPHTIHFHGIHRDLSDGVPGVGQGDIAPGRSTVYELDARPFGVHLYHCHTSPLAEHITRGLYGAVVIDPKEGRPEADELVMVMNGFDTNFDRENEFYAVNTVAFAYAKQPVRVKRDRLVRIYLVNLLEFDLVNSFHLHANFFNVFPTGTSLEPTELTDTIVQGQGQRAILEVRFPYPGKYMFHAHVSEFAELGWMGFFQVVE